MSEYDRQRWLAMTVRHVIKPRVAKLLGTGIPAARAVRIGNRLRRFIALTCIHGAIGRHNMGSADDPYDGGCWLAPGRSE